MNEEQNPSPLGDAFDRVVRKLDGLPDTVRTDPAHDRVINKLTGVSEDWSVQTFRMREEGDTILVTRGAGTNYLRIAIPPRIAKIIIRQYDALSKKNRKRAARETIERRIADGEDIGAALRDPAVRAKARAARKARKPRRRRK